jgi:hypothetical protein
MPRRVLLRLVQLLVVACVCLVPTAAAQAAAPVNDVPTAATAIQGLRWTSLAAPQDIVVQASEWGEATTGPEDADPLPSCTSTTGFRSMWYSVLVPEAAVLRVSVVSTDPVRYQPFVSILDPNNDEVSCGLANDVKVGSKATATAYVTPNVLDGTAATYRVRIANVNANTPSGGLPTLTVSFSGRDVTPPHIIVDLPSGKVQPGVSATYDAMNTSDAASLVNSASAHWVFHDKTPDKRDLVKTKDGQMRVTYAWRSPGPHIVNLTVSDFAGNQSMYKFTTFVQDSVPPRVSFYVTKLPGPGARRLRIRVVADESVRVRLLVTEVGRSAPLYRNVVKFWGEGKHPRAIILRGAVGKGLMVVSGVARDGGGNAAALGSCWIDPVAGRGGCFSP